MSEFNQTDTGSSLSLIDPTKSNQLRYYISKRSTPHLILNENVFHRVDKRPSKAGKIFWRCKKHNSCRCPARLTTQKEEIVHQRGEHNHEPTASALQGIQIFSSLADAYAHIEN